MSEAKVIVDIFDTTLRDGAQALPEGHQFPDNKKPTIASHIARLGASIIEAGFPATAGDGEEVAAVARDVGNTAYVVDTWRDGIKTGTVHRTPTIVGLSRVTEKDIEATWDAVKVAASPRIHTFISTDAAHMAAKFAGKTPAGVLEMGRRGIRHAKDVSNGAPTEFSLEAASTTDLQYACTTTKMSVDEGVDVIRFPDTIGKRKPIWMYNAFKRYIGWVHAINPDVVIAAHNHNDGAMASANSLMAVHAAADYAKENETTVRIQIDTTICGVGERAGNADVFPVVQGLFDYGNEGELAVPIEWQFNPGYSVYTARTVLRFAGLEVHPKNPVVGDDINKHRSGIHSNGILKGDFSIYTPFDPTFWGHAQQAVHEDGKYQGKAGREAAHSRV